MANSFTFHKNIILRTPHFPFVKDIAPDTVNDLFKNKAFMEALYLASPALYEQYLKLELGSIKDVKDIAKIKASVIKYYQRMFSRCTPFGMFAACSVVEWSDKTQIAFAPEFCTRSTRLDMHFMCALAQHIAKLPVIKNRLLYKPNNSFYKLGNEIRYVEYKYHKSRRVHQISSVACSDYLNEVLQTALKGITLMHVEEILLKYVDDKEEISLLIEELLQSQLLVSELEPSITGDEFIVQLIQKLQSINGDGNEEIRSLLNHLNAIVNAIKKIDANKINETEAYKAILNFARALGVEYEENKFFQVDMFKECAEAKLNNKLQEPLMECFGLLNALSIKRGNENLNAFIKRFTERYEDKTISLQMALDTETGLGYPGNEGQVISPLADNVPLPGYDDYNTHNIQWNKTEDWLFKKLLDANAAKAKEVVITEKDLAIIKPDWTDLPPSLSVMFSIADKQQIILQSISGSGAVSLLGRFAGGNKAIHELANDICSTEQKLNDCIAFAEIIHLPEARTGNVLLHPAFREYEIPYLAQSSLPLENQLPLEDIYIKIAGNAIQLLSKKLNKEIIPRLSNAHNYSYLSLPIYHFLCDLQLQKLRGGFSFHWGSLSTKFSFLPRVVYKNVVLFEATWQLKKEDFKLLADAKSENLLIQAANFCKLYDVPPYCVLADGDNELLVDFSNEYSLAAFTAAIKNRNAITLKEFLFTNSAVKNEANEWYVNQFIASVIKTEATYTKKQDTVNTSSTIQSDFIPGSPWLYYKIYCGAKTADHLLLEIIKPLTEKLLAEKKITAWFFIRYNEGGNHIRLRFRIADCFDWKIIIDSITKYLNPALQNGTISKIQTDTYKRELERYGANTIHFAEELFYQDSVCKLQFLENTEGDEREDIRWIWGIRQTEALLNELQFTLEEKILFFAHLKENFAKEFGIDKNTKTSMNKIYNEARSDINKIVFPKNMDVVEGYGSLIIVGEQFSKNIQPVCAQILHYKQSGQLEVSWQNLMSSFIHMSLNRLFPASQRKNEMILYDIMHRHYTSLKAMNKVIK
jgi:lantibiotic biosynthesis protein